ncbi:very short patch repair endonuclease [Mesorhizobium sp.]|uniref:very short patch repair endonuclease n=1 Tax=Mesorhizobium sp. TaxID=1871066 RepID=UPI0025D92484|nr:very short patch repair endonuclease [Mesorhizobium sp.]
MDKLSVERRSRNMAAIRSKDTKPELIVRRFLFSRGLRYRIHDASLAGKPDIVLPGRRIAIFVHGCFWHGCTKCVDGQRRVKSNSAYWFAKVDTNRVRDHRHRRALVRDGWKCLTIWECEVKKISKLEALLRKIRGSDGKKDNWIRPD